MVQRLASWRRRGSCQSTTLGPRLQAAHLSPPCSPVLACAALPSAPGEDVGGKGLVQAIVHQLFHLAVELPPADGQPKFGGNHGGPVVCFPLRGRHEHKQPCQSSRAALQHGHARLHAARRCRSNPQDKDRSAGRSRVARQARDVHQLGIRGMRFCQTLHPAHLRLPLYRRRSGGPGRALATKHIRQRQHATGSSATPLKLSQPGVASSLAGAHKQLEP